MNLIKISTSIFLICSLISYTNQISPRNSRSTRSVDIRRQATIKREHGPMMVKRATEKPLLTKSLSPIELTQQSEPLEETSTDKPIYAKSITDEPIYAKTAPPVPIHPPPILFPEQVVLGKRITLMILMITINDDYNQWSLNIFQIIIFIAPKSPKNSRSSKKKPNPWVLEIQPLFGKPKSHQLTPTNPQIRPGSNRRMQGAEQIMPRFPTHKIPLGEHNTDPIYEVVREGTPPAPSERPSTIDASQNNAIYYASTAVVEPKHRHSYKTQISEEYLQPIDEKPQYLEFLETPILRRSASQPDLSRIDLWSKNEKHPNDLLSVKKFIPPQTYGRKTTFDIQNSGLKIDPTGDGHPNLLYKTESDPDQLLPKDDLRLFGKNHLSNIFYKKRRRTLIYILIDLNYIKINL